MTSTIFANLNRPGVFLTEDTAGFRVPELASFNTVYMLGSAEVGDVNEPTLVTSFADFTNAFGASSSANSVKLYFRNDPNGKLYFIRVGIAATYTVKIDTVVAGTETVSINSIAVNTIVTGAQSKETVRNNMVTAINLSAASTSATAVAVPGQTDTLRIYARNSADVLAVASASSNLTITLATPETPQFNDFVSAIENSFDVEEGWEQGYLIAPEAFDTIASATERLAVGAAMEALCSNKEYDWVAIVDCSAATYANVTALQTEGLAYTSPLGHIAFYGPHLVDLEGAVVPPSAAVVGVATLRNRQQGYQQPPAGARYAIKGVTDVSQRFNNTEQSAVNPNGINLVRYLRNKGVVIWGARTRSSDSAYKFLNTRVIMSALNGTLRNAYDNELFNVIDGRGVLFSRLVETARSVCRRFWLSNALFGASEDEAFEVICDDTNNDLDDIENGNVVLEVYCATSPILEKLLIRSFRVPVGQVQSAAEAGRNVAE